MEQQIETAFCLACRQMNAYQVRDRNVERIVRGTVVRFTEKRAYCAICGEEVYLPSINDINSAAREDAYTKAFALNS